MYLITYEQFVDVVAQENGISVEAIAKNLNLHALRNRTTMHLLDRAYGTIVWLGEAEHQSQCAYPILSFTMPPEKAANKSYKPSLPYLGKIAQGLREKHGMNAQQIAQYLTHANGIKGLYTEAELAAFFELTLPDA